jgi:transcriptional regulator GlxA family with amidase domain
MSRCQAPDLHSSPTSSVHAMAPKNLAILVHDDVEVLDFCGPFEAFGVTGEEGQPYFNVFTVAEELRPVRANTGMIVQPNHSFTDCPDLFMLLVPGGNTRVLTENPRVMAWVAEQEKRVEHLVSVCTGAYVLAELGLLEGLEATTHFSGYDRLQALAPTAVVRRDVRVADNGHIVTGAGVSAGIDLALHMIARLQGMQEADDVAEYMMYRWADEDRARAAADRRSPHAT